MAEKQSVIVGPVRLAFLHIYEPRENLNGKVEYQATLLIPKAPTSQCADPKAIAKEISDTIKATLAERFGAAPTGWQNPFKDGDKELNDLGESKHPGYWYIKACCGVDYPPTIIDGNQQAVLKGSGWQAGHWGRVKLVFFAYDQSSKKGVKAFFNAIQFTHKDEPFGASQDPEAVAAEFGTVAGADVSSPVEEYDEFA